MDTTLEAPQLPLDAGGPGAEVRPGQVRRQRVAGLSSRGFASNRRKKTCLNQSTTTCSLDSDLTRELSCDWAALGFGRAWEVRPAALAAACLSLTSVLRSRYTDRKPLGSLVSRPAPRSRPITATPFWT